MTAVAAYAGVGERERVELSGPQRLVGGDDGSGVALVVADTKMLPRTQLDESK
jgi:hypothetical protein